MTKCDQINIISLFQSARVIDDGHVNGTREAVTQHTENVGGIQKSGSTAHNGQQQTHMGVQKNHESKGDRQRKTIVRLG